MVSIGSHWAPRARGAGCGARSSPHSTPHRMCLLSAGDVAGTMGYSVDRKGIRGSLLVMLCRCGVVVAAACGRSLEYVLKDFVVAPACRRVRSSRTRDRACAAGPGRGDRRAGGRGSVHVLFRIISGFRFACLITPPPRPSPRTDGYAYVRTVAHHTVRHAGSHGAHRRTADAGATLRADVTHTRRITYIIIRCMHAHTFARRWSGRPGAAVAARCFPDARRQRRREKMAQIMWPWAVH